MTIQDSNKQPANAEDMADALAEKGQDFSAKLPILGHAMWLYMQSVPHKYFFIQDIEARVLSPIMLEQCKLYIKTETTGLPMAFVSWAYLSEEAGRRYALSHHLAPADWNSGEELWIIDMIAPFGGGEKIYQELHHSIFKGREIHLLYPSENSGLVKTTIQDLVEGVQGHSSSQDMTQH